MTSPRLRPTFFDDARGVDVVLTLFLLIAGALFLDNHAQWAAWWVFIGASPTGDAAFWWGGVLDAHSGDIATNINLSFRMGFAMIGALITSIVGPDILAFHRVLLGLYLIGAVLMYFALRPVAGRLPAFVGALLMTFNPFIAEWLANMTSDGLGLILNVYALAFFLVGVRGRGSVPYLILFAVFLALAGLTRPLMNLFLAPGLLILFFVHASWMRRGILAGITLATYLVPVIGWMLVLHSQTGMWSVAGHSGSIFYASSDPEIQQWDPKMYPEIEAATRERFDTKSPTPEQIDSVFRRRAVENYLKFWPHHAARIAPTSWVFARSAANASFRELSNNWGYSRVLRLWLLLSLCIAGLAVTLWRGNGLGFFAILFTGTWLVLQLDATQACLILGATFTFALGLLRRKWDLTYPIFAFYMLVGMASMYLVGGIWKMIYGGEWRINALGARLSSQYVFAADLILVLALGAIIGWSIPRWLRARKGYRKVALVPTRIWVKTSHAFRSGVRRLFVPEPFRNLFLPSPGMTLWCRRVAGVLALGVVAFTLWGGVRLTGAVLRHDTLAAATPFPPIAPLVEPLTNSLRAKGFTGEITPQQRWGLFAPWYFGKAEEREPYVLVRGGLSPMIGNIPGQERSFSRFYIQSSASLFRIGHFYGDFEIPQHLDPVHGRNRQGAWLLERLPYEATASHLVFFNSYPAVRAYVPLTADKKAYDLDNVVWFDQTLGLYQFLKQGLLKADATEWRDTVWPGSRGREQPIPRTRTYSPEGDTFTLDLDISPAKNQGQLSFGIEIGSPEQEPSPAKVDVQRRAPGETAWQPLAHMPQVPAVLNERLRHEYHFRSLTKAEPMTLNLDEIPTEAVRLRVTGLREGDEVRLIEPILRAPQMQGLSSP